MQVDLVSAARAAADSAYCPYTCIRVGAAIETDRGVFCGCNVENASLGLTICAERVALCTAVAAGARSFQRLAVSVSSSSNGAEQRMPCGACRQVLCEFMAPDAEIVIDGVGSRTLADLLPAPFRLKQGA